LDEPTSGLDTSTAFTVVESLRNLSETGRTVIFTIHQPSSDIFDQFRDLMLLSEGHIVYFGPASEAVSYFSALGHKCPKHYNPADFFLNLLSNKEGIPKLIRAWEEHTGGSEENELERFKKYPITNRVYAASHWNQMKCLAQRGIRNIVRDPLQMKGRLFQVVLPAILLSLTYVRLGHDQQSIQDRTGLLVFCIMLMAFSSAAGVVAVYALERNSVEHEHSNNTYSLLSYFVSSFFAEFPFQIMFPLIFSLITYWIVGLDTEFQKFLIFLATIIFITFIGQSIGLVVGTAVKDIAIANGVLPLIVIPFVLFGGFFLNQNSTPKYFVWIQYISFFYYAMEILTVNEFNGQKFNCKPDEIIPPGSCRFTSGEDVMSQYSYSANNLGRDFAILAALFIAIRALGFLLLYLRFRKSK